MRTFSDIRQAHQTSPAVLTIGNFDGIHKGHQALLRRVLDHADRLSDRLGGPVVTGLITFEPHPLTVFAPDRAARLLTTPRERLELAAALGITLGVIHPFNRETMETSAEDFVRWLITHLGLAALVVGPDFALGRNRAGDIPALRALGHQSGFELHVLDAVDMEQTPVRSSMIRELLDNGDAIRVAELLGRPYRVTGVVHLGDQRGRTVGIPTANVMAPPGKLLPANGVYATRTFVGNFDRVHCFESVTNVGVRPTVDGTQHRVESHLLDFPAPGQIDDLYGQTIAVDFVARLRGERRFSGLPELVAQIQTDIIQARALFAK